MTTPPSPASPQKLDPLLARLLMRPLKQQLYLVWILGISWAILLSSAALLTHQFFIKGRLTATAEIAITGIIGGMHNYLDLLLDGRDQELQQAGQMAVQQSPAPSKLPGWAQAELDAKLATTFVVWADGQTDARSPPLSPPQLKMAAEALTEHQRQDTGQMRISEPFQSQPNSAWNLQLSRRINTDGGRFQGIVLSYWSGTELESYLAETFFLMEGKSILINQAGQVLANSSLAGTSYGGSVAMASLLGKPYSGNADKNRGNYLGTLTGIDDTARLYVWRKLTNHPLYIVKGVAEASIFNFARPGTLLIIGLIFLVNGLILLSTVWMHVYVRKVNATLKERQDAAQALRSNDERINFALVGSDSAEWELHLPEGRLSVSYHMASLLGYPVRTGPYEPPDWRGFVHPDDQAKLAPMFALRDSTTDLAQVVTLRVRAQNGNYRWLQYRGRTTLRDAAGKATRLSGLATDVTEQQITQSIVRDRTAQLDVIFNLSPDAFVSFDHHLKVKYANPAFGQMTGWRDEAIKGMSEAQFSRRLSQLCVAEHPFGSLAAMRAATLAGGKATPQVIELNSVPQRILRINLQLSDAPTVSQILYLRDVTHETIVEAMKTEFLATAAHELRTPMASILGFAEILCTHPLQQAEQLEFANIIWRQSVHLAGILDDLLDLSRIEARGGKGMVLESFDLNAELDQVIKAFPLPEGRNAPAVKLPQLICKADRDKTRQVLNNVISNAYKFSGPETGITITPAKPAVHPVSGRRLLGLVIRDVGIGMTPEQLGRVFERFYRADKTGTIPGNGLGLSISREIMELMGGQIIIASEPQQGTTVSLMFEQLNEPPLLRPPAEPSPLPTPTTMV